MIYRTKKNADNPYFMLNRSAVNDDRLSYKAVGIHAYLMSKPDSWEANEVDICKRHSDGKSAVRSGVQELLKYGYMTRVQVRKDKKIVGWRLDTYETPELNPHYNADATPDFVVEYLDSENQNVGKDLDSDFLDVENQDVENRNHSNYIKEVSNENQVAVEKQRPAQKRKRESKAYVNPDTNVSTTDILQAYEKAMEHAEPGAIINYGQCSKSAKDLAAAGWTVRDVTTCFWKMKKDEFWRDKHLPLTNVAKQIGAMMGNGRKSPPVGAMVDVATQPTSRRMQQLG